MLNMQGLGKAAVQLIADSGVSDIRVVYTSPRGDDLDTRLLRAMVIKGILEEITESNVNLVNADLLAQNRGLQISEMTIRSEGRTILTSMSVAISSKSSRFSAAVDQSNRIYVKGCVKEGVPWLSKIGKFDVDLTMYGSVLLVRQEDQPGIIAAISQLLGDDNVNVSFMTVCRTAKGEEAIMAIGIDDEPSPEMLAKIPQCKGISEFTIFREM